MKNKENKHYVYLNNVGLCLKEKHTAFIYKQNDSQWGVIICQANVI